MCKKKKQKNKIETLVQTLIDNKLTIATCESASCGKLAATFGSVPGVSACFQGGLITYSNEAKVILANVDYKSINEFSAISSQVAIEMALNCSKLLNTSIGVSITGNAGPSASENQPVGKFFVGLSVFEKTDSYEFLLDPKFSRQEMIDIIINKVIDTIYDIVSLINN